MGVSLENVVPDGFALNPAFNVMYGNVNGFMIMVTALEPNSQYRVTLQADVQQSVHQNQVVQFLKMLENTYPFVHYAGYNGKNTITVNIESQGEQDKENITHIVRDLTGECMNYQLHNCCEACGTPGYVNAVAVDKRPQMLCNNCLAQVNGQQGEEKARRENVLLGIIGAVVGAVIGSVLWILIGQFGFIAGIAGYAIVLGSVKGYEILGKKVSKKGIIICIIISFLTIAFAECFSLGITIYREFRKEYVITVIDALKSVPQFLTIPDVRGEVAKSLVVGYGFAIWANFSFVKKLWKQIKEQEKPHSIVGL